ncbi:MAG: PaaI family thioesterase [Sphingobium sp.]
MGLSFEERAAAQNPPPAYRPIIGLDGFIADNGPIFVMQDEDGGYRFGCRIMPHMCNQLGVAHGGWVATLCDVALPLTARFTVPELAENFMLTVNLSVDYMQGPKLGSWLECSARVLKKTKRMVFVDGLTRSEGELMARASGVFRTGPDGPPLRF